MYRRGAEGKDLTANKAAVLDSEEVSVLWEHILFGALLNLLHI